MTDKPDALLRELDNARRVSAESRSAITKKLETLEDRVQETVADVKQAFDVHHQMQQHPWLMIGGSVLVGYTLARLVTAPRTTATATSSSADHESPPPQRSANESRTPPSNGFAGIKGDVLDVITGTLWAMAMQGVSSSRDTDVRSDATHTEAPFHPRLTDAIDQGKPNGRSTL